MRVAVVFYGMLPRPVQHDVRLDRSLDSLRTAVLPALYRNVVLPSRRRGLDVDVVGHTWSDLFVDA